MKICCKCGKSKSYSEFYKNKKSPDGLQYRCKECSHLHLREWRKKNPIKSSWEWRKNNYLSAHRTDQERKHKIKKVRYCKLCHRNALKKGLCYIHYAQFKKTNP